MQQKDRKDVDKSSKAHQITRTCWHSDIKKAWPITPGAAVIPRLTTEAVAVAVAVAVAAEASCIPLLLVALKDAAAVVVATEVED